MTHTTTPRTYREYMVTVDNGYGGGTAAHGISYQNPLRTAEEAVRVAAHPRNRALAPVILTRDSALGEWTPVRVNTDDYGVTVLTPDRAMVLPDGSVDPVALPSESATPAPVSAREAVRGTEWEMELMPFPIAVPASSNAVAGVMADWIEEAGGLMPIKDGAYYRPYVAEDAPFRRTPNPARTLDYDAQVGYAHAHRFTLAPAVSAL